MRSLAGGLRYADVPVRHLTYGQAAAIMHVHQQPIPLVEVALTPDLHESCLVIATLASPMPGGKKTDRNNNITATFEEKPANGPSAINASI